MHGASMAQAVGHLRRFRGGMHGRAANNEPMRWPVVLRPKRWLRKHWHWPVITPPTVPPTEPPTFTDDEKQP
jgi:hypothetical protein